MTNDSFPNKDSRARPLADLYPPRINWPQIVRDLVAAGCSKYRIAACLGVGISTVQSWEQCSSDIQHGFGRALLRLHSRFCGAALTFQRITEADDSAYTSLA